jgi:hypothetical protein
MIPNQLICGGHKGDIMGLNVGIIGYGGTQIGITSKLIQLIHSK